MALQATAAKRSERRFDTLPDEALIGLADVISLVPVSRAAWWQGCREGRFRHQSGCRRYVGRCGALVTSALSCAPFGRSESAGRLHERRSSRRLRRRDR